MKFVKKVYDDYSLKSLFAQHVSKFNAKHEQELAFLDDVKNFVEKKSLIELQYAQSLGKLCSQYQSKKEYELNSESTDGIYIPEKWKLILEQYNYIAEKRQVSSRSILMLCDYFKTIRDQKVQLHQKAMAYLKKMQDIIKETNKHRENTFRTYCLEQYLTNQLDIKSRIQNNAELEKKLKQRSINVSKFKNLLDDLIKGDTTMEERQRKTDISKLHYVTANCCQNQQLQYYYSMELPEMMHLQNANTDLFINECLNSLAFKERETSDFLIRLFNELLVNASTTSSSDSANRSPCNMPPASFVNEFAGENHYLNSNSCFNNLVQFELQSFDEEAQEFGFNFKKENIKFLRGDYAKWLSKMNDLEELMKTMIVQINAKRFGSETNTDDQDDQGVQSRRQSVAASAQQEEYKINTQIEEERFLIAEKKMQMIQLQAKVDALGSFNISLKELEELSSPTKTAEEPRREFDTDLLQNLELWDVLMKSIDEMNFSDESYDVDIIRKAHSDQTSRAESNSTPGSKEKLNFDFHIDPLAVPRFARTLKSYRAEEESRLLAFEADRSLLIFNEESTGYWIARDVFGKTGLVSSDHLEFYDDENPTFVQSVFHYEGLDEQELSFPADAYVRLLRKSTMSKKIDGEEWWEGVYENKIGYFPAIFVQHIPSSHVDLNRRRESDGRARLVSADASILMSPNFRSISQQQQSNNGQSPFTENQKVP